MTRRARSIAKLAAEAAVLAALFITLAIFFIAYA